MSDDAAPDLTRERGTDQLLAWEREYLADPRDDAGSYVTVSSHDCDDWRDGACSQCEREEDRAWSGAVVRAWRDRALAAEALNAELRARIDALGYDLDRLTHRRR